MSRNAFFADFYVYPTAAFLFVVLAILSDRPRWWQSLGIFAAAFFLWTFVEYLLHRFVLHHVQWVKEQHDVHHHDEKALVGTPTWFSFMIFLAFVTLPVLLASTIAISASITAGLMLGYLWYVTAHYGIHHWRIREDGYLARLKRRHALHHRYDDLGNFGVTTGIWDYVFGTNVQVRRDSAKA